jgi:glyoxylase-like metal-dependent hydrolase (beta-lactamase superfamily II)
MNYVLGGIVVAIICSMANAEDFSKEVVKSTPLGPGMYMLEGAGGNITASIGPNGTLLVDDDFSEMAEKLVLKLKELRGVAPRFILNTHFHYDHTGANEVFGASATIIAATEVRTRLATEQTLWKKQHPAMLPQGLPSITFDKSLILHVNDEEEKMVHLPHGHTDGDSVVFFKKSKVVSMGDLYFSGMYPIFHPEHLGDLEGYKDNVKWVIDKISDDWKVVPGHGPLSNKLDLVLYYQMIVDSIATVRKEMDMGWSLDKIQNTGLNSRWEPFSHGYRNSNQWLESIYKYFEGKKRKEKSVK